MREKADREKRGEVYTCTHEDGKECENHRGADGKLTFWTVGRYQVEGCPQRFVTPEALLVIGMWARTKRHGLPFEGGWMDQPAAVMDWLDVLDTEDAMLTEIAMERSRGHQ